MTRPRLIAALEGLFQAPPTRAGLPQHPVRSHRQRHRPPDGSSSTRRRCHRPARTEHRPAQPRRSPRAIRRVDPAGRPPEQAFQSAVPEPAAATRARRLEPSAVPEPVAVEPEPVRSPSPSGGARARPGGARARPGGARARPGGARARRGGARARPRRSPSRSRSHFPRTCHARGRPCLRWPPLRLRHPRRQPVATPRRSRHPFRYPWAPGRPFCPATCALAARAGPPHVRPASRTHALVDSAAPAMGLINALSSQSRRPLRSARDR